MSCTVNSKIQSIAIQKVGAETPNSAIIVNVLSSPEYCFTAETTPANKPTTTATIDAPVASLQGIRKTNFNFVQNPVLSQIRLAHISVQ